LWKIILSVIMRPPFFPDRNYSISSFAFLPHVSGPSIYIKKKFEFAASLWYNKKWMVRQKNNACFFLLV